VADYNFFVFLNIFQIFISAKKPAYSINRQSFTCWLDNRTAATLAITITTPRTTNGIVIYLLETLILPASMDTSVDQPLLGRERNNNMFPVGPNSPKVTRTHSPLRCKNASKISRQVRQNNMWRERVPEWRLHWHSQQQRNYFCLPSRQLIFVA
jgi:hypothetical protein